MKKAILGRKLGMTQVFTSNGHLVPVTVVLAGPCTVVQKKTAEVDGYASVQVGFDAIPEGRVKKLVNKPKQGHFKKAGVKPMRYLRELRLDECPEIGAVIETGIFSEGEKVDVVGLSRGKGTLGPIARWGLHRGPMSHGSKYHRGLGSMSANSYPGRVFKNKKMAGRTGNARTTIQNLEVVRVDAERNLLLIRGAIPGAAGGLVTICNSIKA